MLSERAIDASNQVREAIDRKDFPTAEELLVHALKDPSAGTQDVVHLSSYLASVRGIRGDNVGAVQALLEGLNRAPSSNQLRIELIGTWCQSSPCGDPAATPVYDAAESLLHGSLSGYEQAQVTALVEQLRATVDVTEHERWRALLAKMADTLTKKKPA